MKYNFCKTRNWDEGGIKIEDHKGYKRLFLAFRIDY